MATTVCINAICRQQNLLLQPEHGVNGRLTIPNATATKTWCALTAKQSAKQRQWPMVTAGPPSATTMRLATASATVDTNAFHLTIVTMVSLETVAMTGKFTAHLIAISPPIGSTVTAGAAAMIRTRVGVAALAMATARTRLTLTSARAALRTWLNIGPNHTILPVIRARELKAISTVMAASTFGTLNMLARSPSTSALSPPTGSMAMEDVAAMTRTRTGVAVLVLEIAQKRFKPTCALAAPHTGRFGTPSLMTVLAIMDRELQATMSVMA